MSDKLRGVLLWGVDIALVWGAFVFFGTMMESTAAIGGAVIVAALLIRSRLQPGTAHPMKTPLLMVALALLLMNAYQLVRLDNQTSSLDSTLSTLKGEVRLVQDGIDNLSRYR